LPARPRGPDSPIRLGLVSPDLCRAPVGYFLIGLLKNLDRQEVTTIAYSDTPRFDDLSAEMKKHTSLWRDVRALADDRLVTAIRADGIDILIDFAGHTKGNRLNVFARRAAPVQASWAGYVGTTGLAAMDYLIADRFHVPEGWEKFYREKVVRLPDGYVCYEPPDYCPEVGPLPAERNGHLTFAGFHNVGKVGPLSIALWSRVLNALPDSRLVLKYKKLTDAAVAARIRETFRSHGIPDERVAIEGTSPHLAMYQRYNDCDIALDARPYSGGLTTLEALWMGVPVVTLPGRTFAGRHSLSHLSTVGLTECIAKDEDDFVRMVVGFVHDLPRLAELRRGLRARMAQSPLCDHKRFADDFTALLKRIVKPAQPISRAAAR
jgi:predicted O-linked N-acetylglucosamine transferase (SPINDLY family)